MKRHKWNDIKRNDTLVRNDTRVVPYEGKFAICH